MTAQLADSTSKWAKYRRDNMMYCLAVYEWQQKLDILAMQKLFERLITPIGSPPDDVWVAPPGKWQGNDYRYSNFLKRDVINQKLWSNLSYMWRRQPNARAYLAAELSVNFDFGRKLKIQIDEASVEGVGEV